MLRETLKRSKGITLVALVVTIIVLLILAGISIAMLTGENGIINRTNEAKEKTEIAQIKELVDLSVIEASQRSGDLTDDSLKKALNGNIGEGKYEISGDVTDGWTITVSGKEFEIDGDGNQGGGSVGTLPTGEGTIPYLPNGTFSEKEGDLSTGLVIKDSNYNEYVWVEVPTTIYTNSKYNTNGIPSSADDWEKIRDCLKAYTVDYSDSSYKDTNTDETTYSDDYKNMLKSVYTNGGFWIGRYEAGLDRDTPRTSYTNLTDRDKAVVKQNKIPYNYVTRDEAQTLAERMNYEGVTSSLIYGVQWDLVLKFIETKGATTKDNLKSDSTTLGNYNNNLWNVTNAKAKYSTNSGNSFTACPYQKTADESVLLTTGADVSCSLMNIYDVAGNVYEWTNEFSNTNVPCVIRGGSYNNNGSTSPAKCRFNGTTSISSSDVSFRIGLWK